MKNNASLIYSLLLLVGDFLALVAAFAAAYLLRFSFFDDGKVATVGGETFLYAIVSILPIWLLVHAVIGLYRQDIYEKRFTELGRLLIGTFIGTLIVIGYDFLVDGKLLPGRLVPVYAFGIGYLFLVVFRTLARDVRRLLYRFGFGVSNILIIGNTAVSRDIAHEAGATANTGLRIIGIVGQKTGNYRAFETFDKAILGLKGQSIHGIIQTELYNDQAKNNAILLHAQTNHISYRFVPGNGDLFVGNIAVELFANYPVVAVHQTALIGWGRILKRIFDLSATLVVMVIALPLMMLVALCIKVTDPRSKVLFRQIRLTRFDRAFQVYKFRTVKTQYNGLTPREAFKKMGQPGLSKQFYENGEYLPKDPRITWLGRLLRQTSLDELPQLFNVLKGDLSLVGPRALVPEDLSDHDKKHAILSVKSGITGLAQISGRKDLGFEDRRKLDVYYVQNWSFWLDISILIRTIRAVLSGSGAK